QKEIKMYTCGPTVYHYAHIGNLRTYIFEDILVKGLEYAGYNVKRVMNITDVGHLANDSDDGEDKMLMGAKREHKTVYEIADFYTKSFFDDCAKLNIRKPKIVEKASDHIDTYIEIVTELLKKDIAYISLGNVYFDISKAHDYYKLSGKNPDDLLIGAREGVEEDKAKRNPYDFGLWFTLSKFEDQAMKWDSPWGVGYPGWHIECSGIAYKYLGENLDIHCGGVDNIFPHHTNEIAQSEAFLGHKWCNYWMHGEHLNDQSGKMSKSKGDFLTVSLLIAKGYDPLAYRYFCLGSHYRKQLVFSFESLDGAVLAYNKLLNKVKALKEDGLLNEEIFNSFHNKFKEQIENDLNTSSMLSLVYDVLKEECNDMTKIKILQDYDKVLSLDLFKETENKNIDEEHILEQIKARTLAKTNKDYQLADEIRKNLLEQGIKLIDTKDGTSYEIM
ncbi:MAG: cysteine--tRNA ligase, partial [Bacilli bacterium]